MSKKSEEPLTHIVHLKSKGGGMFGISLTQKEADAVLLFLKGIDAIRELSDLESEDQKNGE